MYATYVIDWERLYRRARARRLAILVAGAWPGTPPRNLAQNNPPAPRSGSARRACRLPAPRSAPPAA